jgi:hypothetical protein
VGLHNAKSRVTEIYFVLGKKTGFRYTLQSKDPEIINEFKSLIKRDIDAGELDETKSRYAIWEAENVINDRRCNITFSFNGPVNPDWDVRIEAHNVGSPGTRIKAFIHFDRAKGKILWSIPKAAATSETTVLLEVTDKSSDKFLSHIEAQVNKKVDSRMRRIINRENLQLGVLTGPCLVHINKWEDPRKAYIPYGVSEPIELSKKAQENVFEIIDTLHNKMSASELVNLILEKLDPNSTYFYRDHGLKIKQFPGDYFYTDYTKLP